MTYHSHFEEALETPVYETKVKIQRKQNPRKCHSMGLSQNNSKDEAAFNLVLLQLSSQGKTYEEMQKKITKEERLRSVIEKSIEAKKQQIMGKFKLGYQFKDKKEFLRKLFPSRLC